MAIEITGFDLESIAKRLPNSEDAATVSMRAINRSMVAGKTQATKELTNDYTVKSRQISERITMSKASKSNLAAEVTWRGYALNLADFKVTPRKPQPSKRPVLRAMVKKASGMKPYNGAFILKDGRAYRRVTGAGRYPVTGVWGPSIPQLIGADSVKTAIERRALEVLEARLEHEINRKWGV